MNLRNIMNQARLTLSITGIMMLNTTAFAEGNIAEGASWQRATDRLNVTVTVLNSKVTAKAWDNIPANELQTINTLLWNKHSDNYVLIQDFNGDGFLDIGVIKGAGYGGSDICYAIYTYEPIVYSFHNISSMTVCTN